MIFKIIIILIYIITPTLVEAGLLVKPKGVDFLRISPDVRGSSLGEVGVSLYEPGVSGLYWNPAGISRLTKPEIVFIHHQLIEDIKYEFMGYSVPSKNANVGITMAYLHMGKIKGRDELRNPYDYNSYDMATGITYAKKFQYLAYGVTFKNIYSKIGSEKTSSFSIDLGMRYNVPYNLNDSLGLGISLSNIKITEYKFIKENEELPIIFRLGTHYKRSKTELLTIVEVISEKDRKLKFGAGLEYPIFRKPEYENLYLRVGYNSDKNKGLRGGLGIKINRIIINYCYEPNNEYLGHTHRVEINLSLK